MRSLPINRPTLDDPLYSQKNPHQVFLLLLSIVASWPLLRGQASSAVLEKALSDGTVILWGVALLAGSAVALIGDFWRGHTWDALVIERFGLGLVGVAAFVYSWIVWRTAGSQQDVSFAAAITAAYGASCTWRVWQITRRLRWIRQLLNEVEAMRAGQSEEGNGGPP